MSVEDVWVTAMPMSVSTTSIIKAMTVMLPFAFRSRTTVLFMMFLPILSSIQVSSF